MFRLLTSFVLGPFLVALTHGLLGGGGGPLDSLTTGALAQAMLVLVFAVPIGLALFALAWKFRKLQWYWAAAGGAAIGLLFFGPALLPTVLDDGLRGWKKMEALVELGGFVVYTTCVALATWVLGIWRNPALWSRANCSPWRDRSPAPQYPSPANVETLHSQEDRNG